MTKIHHGWWILSGTLISQFVSISIMLMISGVFLEPVVQDLQIEVWQFAFVVSLSSALGAVSLIIFGPVVDSIGPRRVMVIGALCSAASFIGLSIQSSLFALISFHVLCGAFGFTLFGPRILSPTISKWFIYYRGWALTVGSVGVSFAGIITPVLMTSVVDSFGWRTGYLVLAATILLIILPVSMVMRRQPEDMGLLPDLVAKSDIDTTENNLSSALMDDTDRTYTRSLAMKTSSFWFVCIGYGFNMAALSSVVIHGIPFATDAGFSRTLASVALGISGVGNLLSKLLWGWGLSRYDARRLASLAFCISGSGVILLLFSAIGNNIAMLLLGFFLYGFGFGGTIPVSEFLWARYFGRRYIASIRGAGEPFVMTFAMIGPILTGYVFDIHGSYTMAFSMIIVSYIAGAVVINLSSDPPRINNSLH